MLLLDSFQYAAGKEDTALVVVGILYAVLVGYALATVKEVIVIGEVDLDTGRLNRRYLDEQRMIRIVYDQVHTRESDYFMQLVATFVDIAKLGHKVARLESA